MASLGRADRQGGPAPGRRPRPPPGFPVPGPSLSGAVRLLRLPIPACPARLGASAREVSRPATAWGIMAGPNPLSSSPTETIMRATTFLGASAGALLVSALSLAFVAPDHHAEKTFAIGDVVDGKIALQEITHSATGETKIHRLEDYRKDPEKKREGQIVVIDFWSIQCPWSVGYEDRLAALHREYSKRGVQFFGINSNFTEVDLDSEDPFARIRTYMKDAEIGFPILYDKNNLVADRFEAGWTPHVFILDREGVLRYAGGIDDDPKGDRGDQATRYAARALDQLLAGEEVTEPKTKTRGCSIKRRPQR